MVVAAWGAGAESDIGPRVLKCKGRLIPDCESDDKRRRSPTRFGPPVKMPATVRRQSDVASIV
jgi:hypothetical protein